MRYTFGAYTLDTHRYALEYAGIPLQLQPKVFDLLAYLIQHRDRVVTRQELFDTLWPAQFVSDDALEWLMAAARRAVGDSGRAQQVIKTLRGRGYRCVASVEEHPHALPDAALLPVPVHALDVAESPVISQRMHVVPEDEALYVGSGLGRIDLIIIQNQAYRELFAIGGEINATRFVDIVDRG